MSSNIGDNNAAEAPADSKWSETIIDGHGRTIPLTTMTSGVGDVKLSRDRESRDDKLANNCAWRCSCVTSGLGLVGLVCWGTRSVNRMETAPSRRVEDAICLLSSFRTVMLNALPLKPLFAAWLSAT